VRVLDRLATKRWSRYLGVALALWILILFGEYIAWGDRIYLGLALLMLALLVAHVWGAWSTCSREKEIEEMRERR
jgi:hypothetical protein